MSMTPLCNQFAGISVASVTESFTPSGRTPPRRRCRKYDSPILFASTLRPILPHWPRQQVRMLLRSRDPTQYTDLKVSQFKLAPKRPVLCPVVFQDIPNNAQRSQALSQSQQRILADPAFVKALRQHQVKKAMKARRRPKAPHSWPGPALPPAVEADRSVPIRSKPFNEDTDLDPFMLFHELQWPYSPLKADSEKYRQEAAECLEAKEARYRARRGSIGVEGLKDMIHMSYGLGKYGPAGQAAAEESISCEGSPMDIDDYDDYLQ